MTATIDVERPSAVGPAAGTGRRDHLDGLRAVAVYLVVAFHAGLGRFAGGFIGVDVFFVLSGYLVTQLLLRDREEHGSIRFGRFYARRARRLLPASLLMLVVTAPIYGAVAGPVQAAEAESAYRASFLYVANWHFIAEATDYFALDVARSPVLHLWSLAVEEQFYVLWPLLLTGLGWVASRFGGRERHVLRLLVVAGAAASAVWAWSVADTNPARAYFGTEARAYQLLVGAALAMVPGLVRRAERHRALSQVGAIGALGAIGVLAVGFESMGPISRGMGATVATAVLLVALDAEVGGPTRWALSRRPMVALGAMSYATYLWHWPVIVLLTEVTDVASRPLALLTAGLATGLAALSLVLVESPIRTSPWLDRYRWPVVVVGVAASVIGAIVVPPRIGDRDRPAEVSAPADISEFTPVPESIDTGAVYFEKFGETVDCVDDEPQACTVVEGSGPHVLLMGDSNAQMWIPAFTAMAEQRDLTLSLAVASGCLWQREAYKFNEEINAACRKVKEDAYERTIAALDPDLLVLTNAREAPGPPGPYTDGSAVNPILRRSTPDSLDALSAPGRRILIIEPAPTPVDLAFNPLDCLGKAEVVEECRFVADERVSWHDELLRAEAAARDDVDSADLDRFICPFLPICDPVIGETPVFWNSSHITTRFSTSLGPQLGTWLEEQGYLPPAS